MKIFRLTNPIEIVATSSTLTPEQQNVVLIDATTLQKAQRLITGCEACSEDAEIPFDNILDRLTGSDPSVTDYVLERHGSEPRPMII